MATNNKLIYTYSHGSRSISPEILASYADSIIFDPDKRTIWYRGHQIGSSYYDSHYGEVFNDYVNNNASGSFGHAEGTRTEAAGIASHAEGEDTHAFGEASNASGNHTYSHGFASHAEGENTISAGSLSHTEGQSTLTEGEASHAEGIETTAYGDSSHTEGNKTTTHGFASHAEGFETVAQGDQSHAEGYRTYSEGVYSHAEGLTTYSTGKTSHAEGRKTYAEGEASHAEGDSTYATGNFSHAEGRGTHAVGASSHASGRYTYAIGSGSFVSGTQTQAYNPGEFATGQYNESRTGETVFTIGDGSSYENRHNVFEVTKDRINVAAPSYFGAGVYGDLSYSYANFFGSDVPLIELLMASLERPEYTKPVIYTKFYVNGTEISDYYPSYLSPEEAVCYYTMEIGANFHPGIELYWPESINSYGIGTRSSVNPIEDYSTTDPKLLGYSYGLQDGNSVSFKYAWAPDKDYDYTEATTPVSSNHLGLTLALGNTNLHSRNEYETIADIKVSYLESSYIVYSRLWEQGNVQFAYGYGDNSYFGQGILDIPAKLYIISRYPWYSGFGEIIPNDWVQFKHECNWMNKSYIMAKSINDIDECLHKVTKEDSQSSYFYFAVPMEYAPYPVDNMLISVAEQNGLEFNLISDIQPLQRKFMPFPCGDTTVQYVMYYVQFNQAPLGIEGSYIRTHVVGLEPVPDDQLLLNESYWPIATEDYVNISFDNGEAPRPRDWAVVTEDDVYGFNKELTDEIERTLWLG